MINIVNKKDCCGCGACEQECPQRCISLQEDSEGFLYPQVNLKICNNCGLCEHVCPVIHQNEPRKPLYVYAAKNRDEQIRKESSSGGIFTLLAEAILAEGGVVFGARFNDKWEVIHDYTETQEGLANFRGSKYVQSKVGNTFKQTKLFLKQGKKVLYSGTPCQIAGLKKYLRKKYENLLAVDFVCHGVPSPKVLREYIEETKCKLIDKEQKKSSTQNPVFEIRRISFRDKNKGWKKFSFVLDMFNKNGESKIKLITFSETLDKNIYLHGFLQDLFLRPSCHACPSKSLKSSSDITLADFWGINNFYPEFDDNKGISLILSNSAVGVYHLSKLDFDFIQTTYAQAFAGNPSLEKSVKMHKNREKFFIKTESNYISKRIKISTRPPIKERIKISIFYKTNKLLSKFISPEKKLKIWNLIKDKI